LQIEAQEEEPDVVNSLRTDPGQPPAPPEGLGSELGHHAALPYLAGAGHHSTPSNTTAQASLGSQSGHGGSRGSPGHCLHVQLTAEHSYGGVRAGGHGLGGDGPAGGVGLAAGGKQLVGSNDGQGANTSNGNGKNGSDSGSNSPDENGGGAHKRMEKHLHSPGTSYKHRR
jgi:hypothetical protein